MAIDRSDQARCLPRNLYQEADKLDELGRGEEINSPIRRRILDLSEQLREIARLEIRLGIPY